MTLLLFSLCTAVVGGVLLSLSFRRSARTARTGAVIGSVAGLLGPQMVMVPLRYCAFAPEHSYFFTVNVLNTPYTVNAAHLLGILFMGIAAWGTLFVVDQLHLHYQRTGHFFPMQPNQPSQFKGWGWLPWVLLAPTLIFVLLFAYLPAVQTFSLSTRLERLGVSRSADVCLDNFAQLIAGVRQNAEYYVLSDGYGLHVENTDYLRVLSVSLFYAVTITILANMIALAVGFVAFRKLKGANIYRALLIWPFALSPVVTGILFLVIFNPRVGLSDFVLIRAGIPPIPWLQNPSVAPWAITLAATWNIIGFNILFYIAGFQNVPSDLLEAAGVDGANGWQRFWHITLPMLSPIIFFLIFSNLIYTFFDLFGLIDKLTQGGPLESTENLMYTIFKLGIQNKDLGKAAAQSLVLMALVLALTVAQFRLLGRRVTYGA